MGKKALRVVCPHPDHKDENKTFWKEIGTLMVDEKVADLIKEEKTNMRYLPNDSPGVSYMVFPPKDWDDSGGEKKKW